jgi:hypothetical protein
MRHESWIVGRGLGESIELSALFPLPLETGKVLSPVSARLTPDNERNFRGTKVRERIGISCG